MKSLINLIISACLILATPICHADDMTVFLKSCAIGTAAGALVGLATVALSENPSDRTGNIARGASLGLYAGIGFGLYTLYGPQRGQMEFTRSEKNPVWLSALRSDGKLDGAQINWAHISF
jgi:drug/metabolite transporter (DMT)-like permease